MLTKIPNMLTMGRIAVIPVMIATLIGFDAPLGNWVAFAFYTFACLTDFFDGYLARALAQQSAFGRFLDPIADKLLVASVLLLLIGGWAHTRYACDPGSSDFVPRDTGFRLA